MIEFKCSQCGEGMEAPQSLAGQTEECPTCGSTQPIPLLQESTLPASTAIANDPPKADRPLDSTVLPADPSGPQEEPKNQSGGRESRIPGVRAVTIQGRTALYETEDGKRFWSSEEAIAHLPRLRAEKRAAERRAAAKNGPKRQGECGRCGKAPRSLRETEEKHWVCLKCYWELYPALATECQIYNLRRVGFTVPDDLTEKEGKRLWLLYLGRKLGLSLPDDTPLAELLRMDAEDSFIQRLQPVFAAEHERHVTEDIERRSEYLPPVRHFYTKVAGVTYRNDDGSDRQEILSTCSLLQSLRMEHEDNNPHDPNAVRVCTEDGRQIGHLFRDVASDVWWRMQHGFTYAAISANITGGTKANPQLGMNILLLVGRPGVSQEEMQAYLVRIMPAVAADVYDYDPDDHDTDDDDEQDDLDDDSMLE